jgi:hypothetical protein
MGRMPYEIDRAATDAPSLMETALAVWDFLLDRGG